MLKIRGTTVYPQRIFASLDEISAIEGYYIEVSSENDLSDHVDVFVCISDKSFSIKSIEQHLRAKLRVGVSVFERTEEAIKNAVFSQDSRKPIRFFDRRK